MVGSSEPNGASHADTTADLIVMVMVMVMVTGAVVDRWWWTVGACTATGCVLVMAQRIDGCIALMLWEIVATFKNNYPLLACIVTLLMVLVSPSL